MRRYETTIILHPSLSQEERQTLFDKLITLVSNGNGLLVKFDQWGQRKLAYEIRKQTRGYYALLEFCGDGSLVGELERNLRFDDRTLKYMTICIVQEVDKDKVEAEIEARKQEEAAASQLEQEQSPPETQEEPAAEGSSEPDAGQDSTTETEEKEELINGSV